MSSFLAMLPSIEGRLTPVAEELASIQTIDLIATCLLKLPVSRVVEIESGDRSANDRSISRLRPSPKQPG
jgi:hypothetical protein